MMPGQPPNCTASEVLVQLGSGAEAAGLEARVAALEAGPTYMVRTTTFEVPNATGQNLNQVDCLPGETAISGGSQVLVDGQPTIVSWIDISKGGGPLGTPPTGWSDGFSYEPVQAEDVVETWVICVS
jgi:hypothetical protein